MCSSFLETILRELLPKILEASELTTRSALQQDNYTQIFPKNHYYFRPKNRGKNPLPTRRRRLKSSQPTVRSGTREGWHSKPESHRRGSGHVTSAVPRDISIRAKS